MTPDAMHAMASKIEREWGHHGYTFESVEPLGNGAGLALVAHYDGSHFYVASDRWGNTVHADDRTSVVVALRDRSAVSS